MAENTFFEEMSARGGSVRDAYVDVATWLEALPNGQLVVKSEEAEMLFRRMGVTFLVYGREGGNERLIPFDLIPRGCRTPRSRNGRRGRPVRACLPLHRAVPVLKCARNSDGLTRIYRAFTALTGLQRTICCGT